MSEAVKRRGRPRKETVREKGAKPMEEFTPEQRWNIFEEKVRGMMTLTKVNEATRNQRVKEIAAHCMVEIPDKEWWWKLKPMDGSKYLEKNEIYWDGIPCKVFKVQNNIRFVRQRGRKLGYFRCFNPNLFPETSIVFVEDVGEKALKLCGEYLKGKRVK